LCPETRIQRNDTGSNQNARKGSLYQGLCTFLLLGEQLCSKEHNKNFFGINLFNVIDFSREIKQQIKTKSESNFR
jgi:hypothetical protein